MNELILAILMRMNANSTNQSSAPPEAPRLARLALACGRALRYTSAKAEPHVTRAAAWARARAKATAVEGRRLAGLAASRAVEGNLKARLDHNFMELLKLATVSDPTNVAYHASGTLNQWLRQVEPWRARDYSIVMSDQPIELFVGYNVQTTLVPAGTPLLVQKVHALVDGRVPDELLRRLYAYAVQRLQNESSARGGTPCESVESQSSSVVCFPARPASTPAPIGKSAPARASRG